jgi:hypothetical protein
MPTANIQLPDGTKVTVEGSPEEIAKVLSLYGPKGPAIGAEEAPMRERAAKKSPALQGATPYLRELMDESFFSEPRSLSAVQKKLADLGHIFPQNAVSTPLRRLVVARQLRRLKDGGNWVYVRG